jgi:hexokinase
MIQSTRHDTAVDARRINPGFQIFEKHVSGIFLGEVLREVQTDTDCYIKSRSLSSYSAAVSCALTLKLFAPYNG